jgi:hypothetical protein
MFHTILLVSILCFLGTLLVSIISLMDDSMKYDTYNPKILQLIIP